MKFNGWSIVAFIIIFCVIVVAHEFGHMIIAKVNGIRVVEFSVGVGPKIFKFQKGETVYALRLLPFGGYCMFDSEDTLYETDEEAQAKIDENPMENISGMKEGSFKAAPVWARIATIVAGPAFNIILGYVLALIVVGFCGSISTEVGTVSDNSPAMEAGIMPGDVIKKINGERIDTFMELQLMTYTEPVSLWEIEFERNGERMTVNVTPMSDGDRYIIGVTPAEVIKCNNLKIFKYSWFEVKYWLKATFKSLRMLVCGKLTKDDVSGPVGMANVISDTIEETKEYGFGTVLINMVNIGLLLSVNLGIMNLLPVPGLDGGRLLFLLYEAIFRKPVPEKFESLVVIAGFVILIIISGFVFVNDISRWIGL